jgi:hypothetical protein
MEGTLSGLLATVDVLSVAVKSVYQLTELSRGMGWQPPF